MSGLLMLSAGTVGASLNASAAEDKEAVVAESAVSKAYVANDKRVLPNGRYFIYNDYHKVVMTGSKDASNDSFPTYVTGELDAVVFDRDIPQAYLFTLTAQGGGYYTIQNDSGQYLDIVSYGHFRWTNTVSPLLFTPVDTQEAQTYTVSKIVDGKSLSLGLWSDTWFTVHNTSYGYEQRMRFYREETNADVLSVMKLTENLLDDDPQLMTLASGVTADQVRSAYNMASSMPLTQEQRFILDRAMEIVNGTAARMNWSVITPSRSGDPYETAKAIGSPQFATDNISTGLWGVPHTWIAVYVDARENDPLPSLRFRQSLMYWSDMTTVELKRGLNYICVPEPHVGDYSDATEPDVEKGNMCYIVNPHTKT